MHILWDMTVAGSIAIVCVLIARQLMRNAPKVFSYVLWAVVLFRLLCPIQPRITVEVPKTVHQTVQVISPEWVFEEELPYAVMDQVHLASSQGTHIVFLVWVLGVAGMGGYSLYKLLKLKWKLREAIHQGENIYVCDWVDTPFVMGVFRPRIYLPSQIDSPFYMIAHERHHIRRKDHIWKMLGFLALCIHWFNPLVWLSFYLGCMDMEMSCDEAVLHQMGTSVRSEYSQSLLYVAAGQNRSDGIYPAFGKGNVKMRIKNIMNWKTAGKVTRIICGILCFLVFAGCAVTPATETVPSGSTVIYEKDGIKMEMELPEGWEYAMVENIWGDAGMPCEGVRIWNEDFDTSKEILYFLNYPEGFTAASTIQKTDYVLENGANVRVGVRNADKDLWEYIYFLDEEPSYVLHAWGTMNWWEEYGEECIQIINSIKIG